MRNNFIKEIENHIYTDDAIYFITGDLGFGVLDNMKEKLKDRFVNIGVAEQLMTGMSAGLALNKKKVFTYSIANFPTFRASEQIRNDICYHNLDVKVVSVGAGLAYGTHGYTHYGLEDISLMRSFKNIEVICPADKYEAIAAAKYSLQKDGPAYIRLGKNNEPLIHEKPIELNSGLFIPFHNSEDYVVISTGSIGYHSKKAVEKLRNEGISIGFISSPFIKPIDTKFLKSLSGKIKKMFVVEEHYKEGGFGSAILEKICDYDLDIKVKRFYIDPNFKQIGNQAFMLKSMQLDSEGLYSQIKSNLK